jgi:hypothetical protein
MFDLNSIIIGFIKISIIGIIIYLIVTVCTRIKKDIETNINMFWIAVWNNKWNIYILIVIIGCTMFVFNLESVYRPKSVLNTVTEPITMGYDEPYIIHIKVAEKLDREAIFAKNKQQNEAAKEAFRKLE